MNIYAAFLLPVSICVILLMLMSNDALQIPAHSQERIISLAPGITETLFALELGHLLAGRTAWCDWPEQANAIPVVGGYREVNLEAMARLKPSLVILPDDMAFYKTYIQKLGPEVILFDNRTLNGFLRDADLLGRRFSRQEQAERLIASLACLAAINSDHFPRPSLLLAVMEECSMPIKDAMIAGNDGFYNELIQAAGARNAYSGKMAWPRLSAEAIMRLKPDLLTVLAPGCPDAIKNLWLPYADPERILILNASGDSRPGPRSALLLRTLRSFIENWRQKDGQTWMRQ